jgi:predicted acetyltransferase
MLALRAGWSADTMRGSAAAQEELARIQADPSAFLESMEDREAKGPMVKLPDGNEVKRIPGFRRWMWDGEFCGSIGFRWQPGTTALPPHCLGHIGYAVVPWKQGRGMASEALAALLPEAWAVGLPFVELTTDPENRASQRVIERNGGVLHERFTKPPQFGSKPGLRYRIYRGGGA